LTDGELIGNVFPLNDQLAMAMPGETYYAEAWVATAPGDAVGEMSMQLSVGVENLAYNTVLPQTAFQVVQIQGTVTTSGALGFALRIKPSGGSGGCYLVDDVIVIRQ
jgi:hypothetical protein